MMWTRSQLKSNAKSVLSRTLGLAVAVCVIAVLMGAANGMGVAVGGVSAANYLEGKQEYQMFPELPPERFGEEQEDYFREYYGEDFPWEIAPSNSSSFAPVVQVNLFGRHFTVRLPSVAGAVAAVLASLAGLLAIIWRIFIGGPAEVGRASFFLHSRYQEAKMALYFRAFSRKNYGGAVKTIFLRNLYVVLWSLLFVIPGIVKAYSYRMVPYLIAENPEMSASRAMELSRKMTRGEKWSIFVLDLSFIGWNIVASMLCGLGHLVLTPYIQATDAELFAALRVKALSEGYTTVEEIGRP